MLGPAAGNYRTRRRGIAQAARGIGTALVARASEIMRDTGTRNRHIGWTTRESFNCRAGYQPGRRYAMFSGPV